MRETANLLQRPLRSYGHCEYTPHSSEIVVVSINGFKQCQASERESKDHQLQVRQNSIARRKRIHLFK